MADEHADYLLPRQESNSGNIYLWLSLLLNFLLGLYLLGGSKDASTHWTTRAAELAETVSKLDCSGHGKAFVDKGLCECTSCFTGHDCSRKITNCVANSDSGDPLFLEPFWDANAEAGAVVVAPSYRMSYNTDGTWLIHLEEQIRRVHAFVGNAVTEGRYIVLGAGSMQLINAAVESLAGARPSSPAVVVTRAPYYGVYESQTTFFATKNYGWGGDSVEAAKNVNNEDNTTYIEILGAPSNPDFSMQEPLVKGSLTIYDRAYYWPHYSPITKAVDDDLSLFTISKVTGHAGSRLGWAIVKDRQVYDRMVKYIQTNIITISHDTQLRAWKLLEAIIDGYAVKAPSTTPATSADTFAQDQHIFHFANAVMTSRWKRLEQVFQRSDKFSIQTVVPEPQACTFFETTRITSPAYIWIMCKNSSNCYQTFKEAGILGRSGFGANSSYVRFTLMKGNDDFDHFIHRLNIFLDRA